MIKQFKVQKTNFTDRTSMSVEKYLSDVSRLPMVTVDEEVELANRIHQGDEEAKKKLIEANLRFVISVAKSYQHMGMELADLINEGNIGLMTAAEKFDETKGFRFISFAVWWIRQSIINALAVHGRTVRLPLNQIGSLGKINKAIEKFLQENQRKPNEEELSEILNMEPKKIAETIKNGTFDVSLNTPVNEEGDSTMEDMMSDPDAKKTDSLLIDESLKKDIDSLLNILPDKDQKIVKMSFGLGCMEMSFEEIGQTMKLSRERVRQIKEHAVRRLRKSSKVMILKPYLG